MFNFNIFFLHKKKIIYKFLKKKYIKFLIRNSLFKIKNLNIVFIDLLDVYLINKNYKYNNYPTDILTFDYNNELFICNILINKDFKKNFKNLILYYYYLLIHCFLHLQNFYHFNFKSNNLINYLQNKIFLKTFKKC